MWLPGVAPLDGALQPAISATVRPATIRSGGRNLMNVGLMANPLPALTEQLHACTTDQVAR